VLRAWLGAARCGPWLEEQNWGVLTELGCGAPEDTSSAGDLEEKHNSFPA